MAKKKISELPAGGALNGTELVPIVQTGTTKRITAQDIANLGNASGVEGSGTINRLAKFTATSTIGNSQLFDDGTSVGLGTITPLGLLHLFKASAATRMVIDGNAGQNKIITYRTNAVQRFGLYVNNTAESGANAGSDFAIRAYNDAGTLLSTPLFIKRSTGNVGIGSTSPAAILDVNGTGTGAHTILNLQNSQARAAGVGVRINLQPNSDFSALDVGAGISAVNTSGAIQNNTDLIFESGSLGVGYERMRITSAGNVGIGTTNPSERLSVASTDEYLLSWQRTGDSKRWAFGADSSGTFISNRTDSVLPLFIKNSGNVLIGTTTDAGYKLDINGTARVSGAATFSSSVAGTSFTANNRTILTNGGLYDNATNGNNIGIGFAVSTIISTTGNGTYTAQNLGNSTYPWASATFSSSVTATQANLYNNAEQLRIAYDNSGSVYTDFRSDSGGGLLINTSGSYIINYLAGVEKMRIKPNTINFASIPTSATGLSAGDIWNDGGTLKIV